MPASHVPPRAFTIRARLVLLVFAVWLPAAAGIALLAWKTYEREGQSARQRVETLAAALNVAVERELDTCAAIARTLAAAWTGASGDVHAFRQLALTAMAGTPYRAALVDAGGELADGASGGARRVPLAVDLHAAADRPQAVFTTAGSLGPQPLLTVFAPGSFAPAGGYRVGVSLPPAQVQAALAVQPVRNGMLIAVVDQRQRVMARSRDPEKWLGAGATGTVLQRLVRGDTGFAASVTLDGVPSLTYLSPRNGYGWSVVIGMPLADLTASARRLTLQATAASALLLLIGLGLALHCARRIARPVSALREAAAQLGRNEVPARLATGVAEADAVSAAMHEAGSRLQASAQELQLRVQEAVAAAERAQASSLDTQKHEAIGRLTGGLAHDFNNLLQTIAMGLQLVDRSVPPGRHSRAVQAALGACSRAGDLVRQMLAFGRAQPLQPRPVALADFLLAGEELTRKAVGERVRLAAEIAPALPAVRVDPTQLELALLNLLFNARDAMPAGGTITVSARLAAPGEAEGLPPGDYVVLAVADEGTGIAPEQQAKVFEPYFTTKPVGAGTGLGLPQVLAFARQSGGDVRLASELGRGTRVAMLLPACAAAPEASAPGPAAAAAGRPLSVLMVEDDPLVASVVAPMLEAAGHRVTLFPSAEEALRRLEEGGTFDILFTDVVMPGAINGLDLAHWCRMHRPGLPVVLATGYTSQPIAPDLRVLRKPYSLDALLATLRSEAG